MGTAAVPNPIVRMRFSDDAGDTWTPWLEAFLGMKGHASYKAIWRGLGLIEQPGKLFEFSLTDAVTFSVEGGSWNEARP